MDAVTQLSYDVVVVGSGPGGYVAAIRSAQLGKRTAIVERDRIGGRCLNYACIPAKVTLRSADVLSEVRAAGAFGIETGEPRVDFAQISRRRSQVVETLSGGVAGLLAKNSIERIDGVASLTAEGEVSVGDKTIGAPRVILATGSVKRSIPGVAFSERVIGTEEAWALAELPRSMAVVGAGASGVEIASAYARLGTEVSLFESLDRVLPSEDADISKLAERAFRKQGINVHTDTLVSQVESDGDRVKFAFGSQTGEAEWLVIAAGRGPDVDGLALEAAGVELDEHGLIAVDGGLRTSRPGVWAIGDVVAGPALAHKASDEGIIAAEDAAGLTVSEMSHIDIPRVTFCAPTIASFGLTEARARELGHDVTVGKVQYGAVGAGAVHGEPAGMVKIVGEKTYGQLLGAHLVGAKSAELIQELISVKAVDGGYPEIARIVHGHPTLSEAVMEAARAADGWLVHG